jgi:hypothetical protein
VIGSLSASLTTPSDWSRSGMATKQSTPIEELFWARVDRRGDDECWPWTGQRHRCDYGRLRVRGVKRPATHVAWEIANGKPFPLGLHACHTCDNPPCVNPRHLFIGTKGDNYADMRSKGRHTAPPSPKGESHPAARLTAEQVLLIRASTLPASAIAKQFGISVWHVGNIRRGLKWRSLLTPASPEER